MAPTERGATEHRESRQTRRARERMEAKNIAVFGVIGMLPGAVGSAEDRAYDRPLTEGGADLMARRIGWRFAGWAPRSVAYGPFEAEVSFATDPASRFAAVFVPEPDDGTTGLIADGRTKERALRRGLEMARRASPAAGKRGGV